MQVREGYKQTEVGMIPEDWDVSKVEDVAKVVDSLHQTPSFSAEGYPMVRVTDIKTGNLNLNSALRVNEKVFVEFTKNYKPKKDDIVLSRVGSYGVSSFVETYEQFCMGQNTVVIQPIVPARYLYYVLNSRGVRQQIDDGSYGSGYKSLSLKNIKELLVPTPPTATEQRAISTALSDVDALLAAQDKLIAKKRDIKQASMQKLLMGKQRLPGFTGEWEVKRLGDVGEIVTGSTPPTEIKEYWNGSIPWITPTDISDKKDMFSSEREITLLGLQAIRNLPANSLLVTCIASIGKNAILRNKGACNQQINAIIPNDNNSVEFLYYLVENSKSYLLGNAGITATLMISKKDFSEISFSLPPIAEQTAIATILSDMDADLTALEQQRDKTRAIKQGMMQELLTGRIRLV